MGAFYRAFKYVSANQILVKQLLIFKVDFHYSPCYAGAFGMFY